MIFSIISFYFLMKIVFKIYLKYYFIQYESIEIARAIPSSKCSFCGETTHKRQSNNLCKFYKLRNRKLMKSINPLQNQ